MLGLQQRVLRQRLRDGARRRREGEEIKHVEMEYAKKGGAKPSRVAPPCRGLLASYKWMWA